MASLTKWIARLARPPEEVRAETLREWARTFERVTPIADIPLRASCRCVGVIQNIRIDPRETGTMEAEIFDGTGELTARWLGRPAMKGLRLGSGLILEGTVGTGREGELVVLNPDYEVVHGPEHG